MNLYYFDESSFSLSSNIPYGWSPKNETIALEASHSKSLKVLDFLSLDNQLRGYTTTGTIDSIFLIEIFDDFVKQLPKDSKTIIILEELPLEGTTVLKFMKYQWIQIKDYASTQTLEDYTHLVLANYGNQNQFEINFR